MAAGDDAADARLPRLVARAFRGARPALRARLLECLLRPLGALGIASVASGAFVGHLQRWRPGEIRIGLEQASLHRATDVFELANFASQVDAEVWNQVSALLADAATGGAVGLSVAALLLAVRQRDRLRRRE